jgi:arylsulfatase A-like enzyme
MRRVRRHLPWQAIRTGLTTAIGAALAMGTVPSASSHHAPQTDSRPNVVLIMADDLGYGDLSSYGAPDIQTPNLDRLARDGVRMTDFYANAPVCTPARAALISGRYQQRFLLERPMPNDVAIGLPATGRSLPQLLKNAGYATGLIGKWHLGYKPEFSPNRHGFDYFWGYLSGYIDWYTHTAGNGQPDLWENATPTTHAGYFGHEVTRRSIRFIEAHTAAPFFLEVAYGQPHWPYQSPHRASVARDSARHLRDCGRVASGCRPSRAGRERFRRGRCPHKSESRWISRPRFSRRRVCRHLKTRASRAGTCCQS